MIRAATVDDAEGIARVHVDAWRSTYGGLVPDAHLATLNYERRAARWRESLARPLPAFVALDGERVVGFADGGPNRILALPFESELYAIYLDLAVRRGGIGRALVGAVARALAGAGHASMIVWVLRDNPACRFYERLGGTLAGEQEIAIGGATLVEVAYGWPRIDALMQSTESPFSA